jgi:ectoine hydroxylase-related dioxygenase (phytanoyl-CoA dioxygenase family)
MLTGEEIEQYQRDGYVTPDYQLPGLVLDEIAAAHDRLIQRHPEFRDYCSALLAFDTWYLTVARIPELLDMVGQVIGEDIALWNSSFFAKPARVGTKTPWHQDGEYWPIRPLATCTVWIAVDASTTENGCLRVIPGSHRTKRLARHRENNSPGLSLNLELEKAEFDEADAHDIVLERGQVSLHDVYLFHGSEANRSDRHDFALHADDLRLLP